MGEYIIREATEADLIGITELANQYVYNKLSAKDRETGFLTGRFEVPAMKEMVASARSLVALKEQELVGFVINSRLNPEDYPPLVQAMARKLPELYFRNLPLAAYSYFYYGPVLVSKAHRGNKLLPRMFRETQKMHRGKYEIGLAFIHEQNRHSLKVHTEGLGLEIVGQFSFNADNYHILAFPPLAIGS